MGCTLSAADTAAAKAIWAPHGARAPRKSFGAYQLGASMCCPCAVCSTNACSGSPARHARRPWCRRCSSVETRRHPRRPWERALQAAHQLGRQQRKGWCHWDVPGQPTPLHLVEAYDVNLRHRVRESHCYRAFQVLERRRLGTFGGLGGAVHRHACQEGL